MGECGDGGPEGDAGCEEKGGGMPAVVPGADAVEAGEWVEPDERCGMVGCVGWGGGVGGFDEEGG